MASGRGWILQQHIRKAKKPGATSQTSSPSLPSETATLKIQHRSVPIPKFALEKKGPFVRKPMKNKQLMKTCQATYIESIPCEILMKIFSYLDPISLMLVGSVSKRFYELSKDNVIWYKVYIAHRKVNQRWSNTVNSLGEKISNTTVSDLQPGHWKRTYVRELTMTMEKKIIQIMKTVKRYSSSDTAISMEKAVRMSRLSWTITFVDVHGIETMIEQTSMHFRDSSLNVAWNCYLWPEFRSLTKLRLHGMTPVTDYCLKPVKNGLRRLSLIAEYDLRNKKDFGRYIGQDMHIKLFHLHPGLVVGLWKKSPAIAFVMGKLHYHQLLEKSFLGSADNAYIFPPHIPILDDIDPEYGLHGYQLHIDMYSGQRTYLCRIFRGLFCRKEYIHNGYLRMAAIGLLNNRAHVPLAGRVDFFWETLTISGSIQNCFMMDVTVIDEAETPFWCFSAPVQLCESKSSETLYDFMGQSFDLNYKDDIGKVHAELMWIKEAEEYHVINLVLYLNTEKVNSHFGTNYTDSPVD
ncbi:F-box only protein 15 [Leptodactylus fuscus]|uniref:F-box only protein 15 n=1 Tax=Leptodactylus fuscus TaxID=238119 RepID=UPI003F4EEBFD